MTATVDEKTQGAAGAGGVGRIARVIGPVVDIEFRRTRCRRSTTRSPAS
ncbi:MAG: hypothetical protein R2731_14975 [Nocardioides sp.]